MKKLIDGTKIIDGREMLMESNISLFPIIGGIAQVLGDDVMCLYLHEFFGEDAEFYPCYADIGLGESKGWANTIQQMKFINYIMSKLSVTEGYSYKDWIGKYEHIICD